MIYLILKGQDMLDRNDEDGTLEVGCPEYSIFRGRVGEKISLNVMDWETCADICKGREGCKYWTWHMGKHPQPDFRLKCTTMTDALLIDFGYYNTYSGKRSCGDTVIIPPGKF